MCDEKQCRSARIILSFVMGILLGATAIILYHYDMDMGASILFVFAMFSCGCGYYHSEHTTIGFYSHTIYGRRLVGTDDSITC